MDTLKSNDLLMLFQKNPVLGKVKTRLAAGIGEEKALEIYKSLLQYTYQQISQLKDTKLWIWFDSFPTEKHLISVKFEFEKKLQVGSDLGQKMSFAFQEAFNAGYRKVVLIGSDCPELKTEIIQKAFVELENHQVVIGPAKDGGYYLIGMSFFEPSIFEGVLWSTSHVFAETMKLIEAKGLSVSLLSTLSDLDTEEDLKNYQKRISNIQDLNIWKPI